MATKYRQQKERTGLGRESRGWAGLRAEHPAPALGHVGDNPFPWRAEALPQPLTPEISSVLFLKCSFIFFTPLLIFPPLSPPSFSSFSRLIASLAKPEAAAT